jgi:endo-1,4-beta-D-glucanase Y
MDADLQKMWQAWRNTYLVSRGAGTNGLRVTTAEAADYSISEETGYGLLISAYMANGANTGKSDFDAIYRYYKAKEKVVVSGSTTTRYGLMAWRVNADGTIQDNYVAPDGDIDAAYALLIADKKFGSTGAINYKQEAVNIINSLMKWTVINRGANDSKLVYRADMTLNRTERDTDYTVSSYQIVSYFSQFQKAANDSKWSATQAAGYKFYNHFYNANPSTGLMPFTFLTQAGTTQYTKPASRGYAYSFDACRQPWRVAMDYLWYGNRNSTAAKVTYPQISGTLAKDVPNRNTNWLKAVSNGDPQLVASSYNIDGTRVEGSYLARNAIWSRQWQSERW